MNTSEYISFSDVIFIGQLVIL